MSILPYFLSFVRPGYFTVVEIYPNHMNEAHTGGKKVISRDVLNALDDREDVRSFQGRECKRSCCQRVS